MRTTEPSPRDALLEVIARAASPRERSHAPCFGPHAEPTPGAVLDRREAEWARLLTSGDRDALGALLAARGIDRSDARRGLADVAVIDAAALPAWARDVLLLFDGDADDTRVASPPAFTVGELTDDRVLLGATDPASPWSLHRAFEPLLHRGAVALAALVAGAPVAVGDAAQRQLLAALARRLGAPCALLLLHPADGGPATPADPDRPTVQRVYFGDDGPPLHQWRRLFAAYPVVARLLAVAFRHWCDATAELLARVGRDHARLEAALAPGGRDLGALVGCSIGIGDSHDRGRTVAVLTFASDTRAVYKPKDLRVAAAYMRLVDRLNAAEIEPALPTRRIVEGDGYGWEEFVPERPCTSAREVRRFYERVGMQARVVELLDGLDFTGDNIIASGDTPALVDLEALLAPRIPVHDQAPAADAALEAAFQSPARGCLVTAKILGERGRPAAELGALAPAATCFAPFKQRVLRGTEAGPALVDVYPEFPAFRATPTYDGARVRSTDHFDDVSRGYVAMGDHLRRMRAALADEAGPLAAMRDVRVRCLCRDTHIYGRMLQSSLTPARLRDGLAREMCLERLWKARFPDTAVVQAEIDALRDLDVPMFASCAGSTALLHEGAVLVEDFFAGTAAERLAERARALGDRSPARDRELIESVLFTLAPTVPRRARDAVAARRGRTADWRTAAERVGREIADAAVGASDDPRWIGGRFQPWNGCWSFTMLADDLYGGTAGIGLVLAELAAATGDAGVARVATAALREVGRRAARTHAQMAVNPLGQPPGAMFGWGGRLYACDRGGQLLADGSLHELPTRLLEAFARSGEEGVAEMFARAGAWDVATGAAGIQLVALAGEAGAARDRALVASAAARVLAARGEEDAAASPLYPPGARPRGIIGDALGRRLALARAAAAPPSPPPPSPAAPLEAGDLLALASLAQVDAAVRADALRAIDRQLATRPGDRDGLGWVERGEVALAAFALDGDARRLALAHDAGERLLALKARTGRWFPECLLADRYNLSAVVGLGAVAHLFLRLHAPAVLRSHRVVE